MKKIISYETRTFLVKTGRNFGEASAKNWLRNNFPAKKALRSLVAQGWSVADAKKIIEGIRDVLDKPYSISTRRGYVRIFGVSW